MKCSFCRRLGAGEPLPRGWKVCGRLILCQECQRQRYRRKSLTMPVRDSIGARWPVFEAALEEAWTQATPLLISGAEWELTILGNQPLIRVSIGTRRWLLTLHCAKWSRGRKIAAERIASGQAVAKELFFAAGHRAASAASMALIATNHCLIKSYAGWWHGFPVPDRPCSAPPKAVEGSGTEEPSGSPESEHRGDCY